MHNNRRILLGLGLLAAAPWLLGAAGDGSSIEERRTVVTVTGRAEQPRQPPFVVLAAGVGSEASTASGAMHANARIIARLRNVLGRMNIRPQDIRSSRLSLSPRRDRDDQTRIVGFTANHRLSVVFRDIEQSGAVIDLLVDAGATDIEGPQVSWWRGNERANPRARHAAIVDANNQANAYARSLGLRVRRVLKMSDGGGHVSSTAAASIQHRAGTEIMPGEEVMHTTVNAEYELVR